MQIHLLNIHDYITILQLSSDLSILDFDIPFSIVFVAASGTELLAIIGIMTFVTWQVLVVAIFAMVAVRFVQVDQAFTS